MTTSSRLVLEFCTNGGTARPTPIDVSLWQLQPPVPDRLLVCPGVVQSDLPKKSSNRPGFRKVDTDGLYTVNAASAVPYLCLHRENVNGAWFAVETASGRLGLPYADKRDGGTVTVDLCNAVPGCTYVLRVECTVQGNSMWKEAIFGQDTTLRVTIGAPPSPPSERKVASKVTSATQAPLIERKTQISSLSSSDLMGADLYDTKMELIVGAQLRELREQGHWEQHLTLINSAKIPSHVLDLERSATSFYKGDRNSSFAQLGSVMDHLRGLQASPTREFHQLYAEIQLSACFRGSLGHLKQAITLLEAIRPKILLSKNKLLMGQYWYNWGALQLELSRQPHAGVPDAKADEGTSQGLDMAVEAFQSAGPDWKAMFVRSILRRIQYRWRRGLDDSNKASDDLTKLVDFAGGVSNRVHVQLLLAQAEVLTFLGEQRGAKAFAIAAHSKARSDGFTGEVHFASQALGGVPVQGKRKLEEDTPEESNKRQKLPEVKMDLQAPEPSPDSLLPALKRDGTLPLFVTDSSDDNFLIESPRTQTAATAETASKEDYVTDLEMAALPDESQSSPVDVSSFLN